MIPLRNFSRFMSKASKQPGYAFFVAAKRARAQYFYHFGKGRSSSPESITFFLTHRCNLRCKMCGQWGEGGITGKQSQQHIQQQSSLEQLKGIVDDIARFKPSVTLFGGEPLLFAGISELISHIKRKGLHCLVITNGSLLEEMAEEIVKSGLDELNISLDGAGALHDEIRGMPGLFSKIVKGINKVQASKAIGHKDKPLINLQCTITKYNYQQLEQMLDVAKDVRADSLTYHNLIFIEQAAIDRQKAIDESLGCSSSDWQGFVFEPGIDPQALDELRRQLLGAKHGFPVDFYPNFTCAELEEYYRDPCYSPLAGRARCLSPWLVAYVFPDGEVRPCLNCSYSFGNVLREKFMKLWNGGQAVKYRRLLKEKGTFPVCSRCTELNRY